MAKQYTNPLDRTFQALSDPTRRAMLAALTARETLSVSELAAPFAIALPSAMKHLAVLEDAGLLRREKTGRTVHCRLEAAPMREAMAWLETYQRFWTQQLDALERYLEEETPCEPTNAPDTSPPTTAPEPSRRASPSAAPSKARRRKSSAPGPSRKR